MSGTNTNLLWSNLKQKGLYTKSYNDFVDQFSDADSQTQLHGALVAQNLYNRNSNDFANQFFKSENSYKYIKHRKVTDSKDIYSSYHHMISNNQYGKNGDLTGDIKLAFFGSDVDALINPKHAGRKKGIKLLNKYSAQTWINHFGGG